MATQAARLERWSVAGNKRHGVRLQGYTYGHPHFPDGEFVTTSIVKSPPDDIKQGNKILTRNTEYELGEPFEGED